MNALPIILLLALVFGGPFAWLWWEARHTPEPPADAGRAAAMKAAADPAIRALPCLDAAAAIHAAWLLAEIDAHLSTGRRA